VRREISPLEPRNRFSHSRDILDRVYPFKNETPFDTGFNIPPHLNKSLPQLPSYPPSRFAETSANINITPSYDTHNYRRFNDLPRETKLLEPRLNTHFSSKPRHEKVYSEKVYSDKHSDLDKYVRFDTDKCDGKKSANVKSSTNYKIFPSDRIYEIRKEKIMIKADRVSKSPVSEGASANIEKGCVNNNNNNSYEKTNYILIDKTPAVNINEPSVYSKSSTNLYNVRKACHKEIVAPQKKRCNQVSDDLSDDYAVISSLSRKGNNHVRPIDKCFENLNKSDIIYVPMIKEEFILRESRKQMKGHSTEHL
jgi:hypothetical protein